MTILTIDESDVTPDLDARVRAALAACFPNDAAAFGQTRAWHGSGPVVSFVATDDASGLLAGHVGIHDRVVTVGGTPVHVAGVQNVCVLPAYRKTGLFDRMMAHAAAEAAARRYDAGLLFCLPALQRVYARCGWQPMPGRSVTRVDETGAELGLPSYDVPMFLPMKLEALPPGDVHLRGNDW